MPNYTSEKNVLILLSLLKQYHIRKIVASPGTTNITFIASAQSDPFFEIYSSVDERSAAYIACGLSAESGEAVVLSCTGATASRNYMPGLTEAFYKKLPILAVTSTQSTKRVGQLVAQIIDRSSVPNDVVKGSFLIPVVKDKSDDDFCLLKVNEALQCLFNAGGGPVHINLETSYSKNFEINELPNIQRITSIGPFDKFPSLPNGKIGIFIGSHKRWNKAELQLIDKFCTLFDAVVICDHTSGYFGDFRILSALIATQENANKDLFKFDLLIHLGEISGDYDSLSRVKAHEVWRVNSDGILRNTFGKLSYIFSMPEVEFFEKYTLNKNIEEKGYYAIKKFNDEKNEILTHIPELPFSNIWIAQQLHDKLPQNCNLYLGILNTLRSWNFFEVDPSINTYANVGGFGIDGMMSSMLGTSLANPNKINIGIVGDLGFFYDMNVLGNRHVGKNFKILLINNGLGTEFKNYNHFAARFGEAADKFIAAYGHFGNQSRDLVKHYAQDLGFIYWGVNNKKEFLASIEKFISTELQAPAIMEVFTNSTDESNSFQMIKKIKGEKTHGFYRKWKPCVKKLLRLKLR